MKHRLCLDDFIGLVGFEPTASWSRTRRSTKLSHSPKLNGLPDRRPLTSRILSQIRSEERREGKAFSVWSPWSCQRCGGQYDQSNSRKTRHNVGRFFCCLTRSNETLSVPR